MSEEPATAIMGPREIAAILYRHRYWLLVPMIMGLLAAVAATLLITPIYRSSTSLLITSQQIPTSVVPAPLTNYADERIAKIRQQIMSRENLTRLIESRGLYVDERRALPVDAVVALMRSAIGVDLVGANAASQPGQGGTIAFNLSYRYRDPRLAQDVTRQLSTMFVNEDKRLRTEQAAGTAAFLGRRADELREQLVALAGRRRAVEARYAGALPEQVALSAQAGAGLRAEVSRIDAEGSGLMQQNGLLAARGQELAATPPSGMDELRRAEERLNQLSTRYSDDFPDVAAARDAVERQRASVARNARPNPVAGAISAEVSAGRARIGQLAGRRAALVQSLAGMERMASLAPQAGYELNNLQRDYESLRLQYQGIREKQMEAQVAANLQTEDKGERFTMVDAPSFPTVPLGPGRVQMLATGAFGGLGLALVLLAGWEIFSGPIHGASGVTRHMGAPPIVVVPMLRPGDGRSLLTKLLCKLPWRERSRTQWMWS